MNRLKRAECAKETLEIFERGSYTVNNDVVNIRLLHEYSLNNACLIDPEQVSQLNPPKILIHKPQYSVVNESVVTVIRKLHSTAGVLNFASAKNPGGGFLSGSLAQEEALAMCSNLYPTQIRNSAYYDENRKPSVNALYTDYMIYSPGVVFIRDGEKLLTPVTANVLTAPAVNMGAYLASGGGAGAAEKVMASRMEKVLKVFAANGDTTLILGAYGCGVFKNDPDFIASTFYKLLTAQKYGEYFDNVIFAVFDNSSTLRVIRPFLKYFS